MDRNSNHYLLMTLGWEGKKRLHGCLVHLEIIDGKIWVQRDGTEDGIATELVAADIPKSAFWLFILLTFGRIPSMRWVEV